MKVLVTLYPLNNFGGIILNTENLIAGFRELGHEAEARLLVFKETIQTANSTRALEQERGALGIRFDQERGWMWPANMRFAYKGARNLKRWKEYANKFDLVIWQIPVPTKQRANRGNTDWLELYDLEAKQIAYTHDGNMKARYPWISAIAEKLVGAVGVHPCAYHALADLPLPRAMAFSPQKDIEARVEAADKVDPRSRKGWFSLQTFKGWKHVEDLIRAVPHMENREQKVLAGGGLHYSYMTSPDKVKAEYLASGEYDPDMPPEFAGRRIFDLAKEHGMEYLGYIVSTAADENMRGVKYLIDPSWSKKYSQIGDHFNRTSVEGIINGAVPIARNLGVATNEEGAGEFFKPGRNYLMIPWNATPKEFAQAVDEYLNIPNKTRLDILHTARKLLPMFDYKNVAQTFLDLAAGKPAGVYAKPDDRGEHCEELVSASEEVMNSFFRAESAEAAE